MAQYEGYINTYICCSCGRTLVGSHRVIIMGVGNRYVGVVLFDFDMFINGEKFYDFI